MPNDISPPKSSGRETLSVSSLNRQVKRLLEVNYSSVYVEGELSNVAKPSSGHYYFTLKDAGAQVRCAMFRSRTALLKFNPKEGDHVVVRAKLSLYEARGDYQLIVDAMKPAGAGALSVAFEQLKAKLLGEGLFDESVKQALPDMPMNIGIVTSPTGAAIRDILSVLSRRFPLANVQIYPVAVQGEEAVAQLIEAIELANKAAVSEVLIVGRGGGSIEDLWAFNAERLARTIYASEIPIVSAVGHEVDYTIADFVADVRAPTPSVAAELVVPDQEDIMGQLEGIEIRLTTTMLQLLQRSQWLLSSLQKRLRSPQQRLNEKSQRLDDLAARLKQAMQYRLEQERVQLDHLMLRLRQASPASQLTRSRMQLDALEQRFAFFMKNQLQASTQQLTLLAARLQAVSPLAVLQRGYSIVSDKQGQVVRSSQQVEVGDKVCVQPADGLIHCEVLSINK